MVDWCHHIHVAVRRSTVLGENTVRIKPLVFVSETRALDSPSLFSKEIIADVRKGEVKFEGKAWKKISSDAKDFILNLLKKDPEQRLTAKAAFQHRFIKQSMKLSTIRPEHKQLTDKVKGNLERHAGSCDFKKIAMMVIAKKMTSEEIFELRQVFAEFDTDKDGTISYSEFKESLSRSGYTNDEIESIFCRIVSC